MKKPVKTRGVHAGKKQAPDATHQPKRILVVDDEASMRQLGTEVLIRHGYQVDVAEDGDAAWETIQRNRYDLLVTDNSMPRVSGVELLKKLHSARMAVPVIMVTGTLPTEEFTRFPWLRPAAMLLKPYVIEEFLGAVKEALRAAADVREPVTQLSEWQSQPSTQGWQFS